MIKGSKGSSGRTQAPYVPQEAPNTLRSKSVARIIDLISEGEIDGLIDGAKGVFFDEVPLQNPDNSFNFDGVELIERVGASDQDPIPGFADSESEVAVGQAITDSSPAVFTVIDQDIDAVRVKIATSGLFLQTEKGDIVGTSVQFKIELQPFGGSFAVVSQPIIDGKTVGPYEQQHRVPLTGTAPWTVRVSRITPDSTDPKLKNALSLPGYTEVIEAKLVYPDSALVALKLDSQLFGGRLPRRSYKIKGVKIRIPTNYDPLTRVYSPSFWDGTFKVEWTDNPAWVFHDILVERRYGLGDFIDLDQVDKFALFEIAQYCDELVPDGFGGTEPRFVFNGMINTRQEAYALVNAIASVFRGMAFWSAGAVTASQDAPKDVSRLVAPADVLNGDFVYEGSSLRAQHTAALVTWNDPADNYRPAIEVVEDQVLIQAGRGWRPVEVAAYGTTSRGQAARMGKWILDSEKNETETVRYVAGFDHADTQPGEIIAISDPVRAGAQLGGRIVSISGTDVTLDRNYDVDTGDEILLQMDDDTIETITLSGNSAPNIVTLASPPTATTVINSMFLIKKTTAVPEEWKIISNRQIEDNQYEIVALRHDETKYDRIELGINLDPAPTSLFPKGALLPVTNLTVTESLYKSNNAIKTRLSISFTPSIDPRATIYRVEIKKPENNFQILQISPASTAEFLDAEIGLWDIAVTALADGNEFGSDSSRVEVLDFEVFGKTAPPPDVQNFVGDRRDNGILLTWDAVDDIDLVGYDIRQGADWETAKIIVEGLVATTLFVPLDSNAQEIFLIRAKDTLGILSINVTSVNTTVSPPPGVQDFFMLSQDSNVYGTWSAVPGSLIEYEIRFGETWESGQFLLRTNSTELTTLFPIKDVGQVRFHIKSISTAGLFSDDAAFFVLGVAPVVNRNEILQRDEQALGWPGIKNNVEVVSTNLLLKEISPGVSSVYGEYSVLVDLGQNWRARNWIETRAILVAAGALIWDDATFSWDSPQANVPWLPTADLEAGTLIASLAPEGPLPASLAEGWKLESDLIGVVSATAPIESLGVSHVTARYRDGLQMTPFTKVAWTFAIPTVFSLVMTIKYDEIPINDVVYYSLNSPTGWIELGFDASTSEIYLEDELGNRLAVIPQITVDQFAIVGMSQDATTRRLFVREIETGTTLTDSGLIGSIGSIDTIALHAV